MRKRMSRGKSRRNFKSGAKGTQSLNLRTAPMRGGFRI